MRPANTLLWIGALLTASTAIRCGGVTDGPPFTDASAADGDQPSADAEVDVAAQGGQAGQAGQDEPGGAAGVSAGGDAGEDVGGNGGGRRVDGGNLGGGDSGRIFRDGGGREGGPRGGQGGAITDGASACPASVPSDTDPCSTKDPCAYEGKLCTCPWTRGEPASWTCFRAPVTPDAATCPAVAPQDADECTLQGLSCRYGQKQCFCGGARHDDGAAPTAAWNCK